MVRRVEPVIRGMCPNCGGSISASRLERGLPCARCLPGDHYYTVEEVGRALLERGNLRGYGWVYDLEVRFREFKAYFERKTGGRLWSAQASWAKRLLMLESMAIVAPTGVGKTTLLMVYAAYRAERDGWRILYVVPTQNLVRQVAEKLAALVDGVLYYTGTMSRKRREETLARVRAGDFRVLIVTTSFVQRGFDLLLEVSPFELVIVDDVDSLLRSGSNVTRVLRLMGYTERTISVAEEIVKTRLKLYSALAAGKEARVGELQERLARLEAELALEEKPPFSQLVIASATGRPRGVKHYLFRELLGFEVGGGSDYMRSVTDAYVVTDNVVEETVRLVRKLGSGTIVFVSQLIGKQGARIIAEKLRKAGLRIAIALAGSRRAVAKLAKGEVDAIVGVASRYGVVVRGIDLPQAVRHAVFVEVPARRQRLEDALSSPRRMLTILLALKSEGMGEAGRRAEKLMRMLDKVGDTRPVALALKGRIEPEGLLAEIVSFMRETIPLVVRWVRSTVTGRGGRWRIGGLVVEEEDGQLYLIIPDAPTYLQASGRTSRLYKGVMTHGLSVIVSGSPERVEALGERLRWYTSSKLLPLEEVDLEEVRKRIEDTRRGIGKRVIVKTVLFIVESPTKARTIAWFWGRPGKRRFGRLTVYEASTADEETGIVYLLTITSSRGHVVDLAIDEEESVYGVRVENGIFRPVYTTIKRCLHCGYTYAGDGACPRCGSTRSHSTMTTIQALRKLALEVDEIIIASDPDREGEKIAWDLYLAIRPYNPNIKRGRFHEVTRRAVLEALRNPQEIDRRLVESQIVRRIEDRWIGFSLSRHLWTVYGKRWLGAGRVQTPVLGWVVRRYEEWKENRGYATVLRHEETGDRLVVFTRSRPTWKVGEPVEAVVESLERWEEEVLPPPPYTTDEMLYDASRKLGYSTAFTMKLAQDLFESGLITYHRTDSTRVSPTGMAIAREYLERKGLQGEYQGRPWGEGGAHEAIRPTRPLDAEEVRRAVLEGGLRVPVKLTRAHYRLYDLIFRRFIASQMRPSRIARVRATLKIESVRVEEERPTGYSGGYALVNPPRTSPLLARVASGDRLKLVAVKVVRASSVRLYRTGDLVRLMKENRIGRPSTYAKAIESNRRHGYIVYSKRMSYVIPTKTGRAVYEYLSTHFPTLVSVDTSRRLEELLDSVENGRIDAGEALEMVAGMISEVLYDEDIVRAFGGAEAVA